MVQIVCCMHYKGQIVPYSPTTSKSDGSSSIKKDFGRNGQLFSQLNVFVKFAIEFV